MQPKLLKLTDTLTPDLTRKLKAVQNRAGVLRAMGQQVKSMARAAFTESELRPSTWAPRKQEPKDGHRLLLGTSQPKGKASPPMLRGSIRVLSFDNTRVVIGSDRPYAAAHQLGSPKNNLPARPFLPFFPSGALTPEGQKRVGRVLTAWLKARGL
jgi:phage gpG-like protein